MGINDELIKEIVKRITKIAKPDRILLFGSAAKGEMNQDSDIDLLVLEPAPKNTLKERIRLRSALIGLGYPFDIFVMQTDKYEKTKTIIGGMAYPVNKNGWAIYAA